MSDATPTPDSAPENSPVIENPATDSPSPTSPPSPGTYLDLADIASGGGHQITVFWAASQPDRIHMAFTDPRLVNADGEKPGLRLVFSSNPRSADYSPANFNRLARLLREKGMPAPATDAPEHPRHLRYREKVIETVLGAQAKTVPSPLPAGGKQPPSLADAEVCPSCTAYVADLDVHMKNAHTGNQQNG